MKSVFLNKYRDEMYKILKRKYDFLDEEDLLEFIETTIKERINKPKCIFSNDYVKEIQEINLLQFTDFLLKSKPLITGYGTVYKQHTDETSINNTADMLDFLLKSRKVYKKKMFKCMNEKDDEGVKLNDMIQKTIKLLANSYYGASGEKSAQFYNPRIGPSVTYSGVQIITTSVIAFERFLENNIKFKSIDEIYIFVENVLSEEIVDDRGIIDSDGFIDKEELVDYLIECTTDDTIIDREALKDFVKDLDVNQCTSIYYKNNLFTLMQNSEYIQDEIIGGLLDQPYLSIEEFPEDIESRLNDFWNIAQKHVFYDYAVYDRYERCLNDERRSILVVDTDSNFINLDPWFKFVTSIYDVPSTTEMRVSIINLMVYVLTQFIQKALDRLTENCNVTAEKMPIINMKNEFLYKRLMATSNKKQYVGTLIGQEGNLIDPPEVDMKGLSIKKANVNHRTREYFTEIIENDILNQEEIDLNVILGKFKEFEDEIRTSLRAGELTFATPAKVNEIDSYAMPYRIGPVRATIAYNYLYPDEPIQPPVKINTLKLLGEKKEDLKSIFDLPQYKIIDEKIFGHPKDEFNKHGFKLMGLPKNVDKTPEWIIPLIDVESIVSDNVRNGIIILESLGVKVMTLLNSKNYYSNVINF